MFAMMDNKTALRCLQQILDQLGIDYRKAKLCEESEFFYEDKNGNDRKIMNKEENSPVVKFLDVLLDKGTNRIGK